jgi:hypothetical protein
MRHTHPPAEIARFLRVYIKTVGKFSSCGRHMGFFDPPPPWWAPSSPHSGGPEIKKKPEPNDTPLTYGRIWLDESPLLADSNRNKQRQDVKFPQTGGGGGSLEAGFDVKRR